METSFRILDSKVWLVLFLNLSCGGVAQLVRASACHAEGHGFESRHSRQVETLIGLPDRSFVFARLCSCDIFSHEQCSTVGS
jgi:hypothetical protein